MNVVEADAVVFAEGCTDAPRGGEKATKLRTEAPAHGESRRQRLLPWSYGRPRWSGRVRLHRGL